MKNLNNNQKIYSKKTKNTMKNSKLKANKLKIYSKKMKIIKTSFKIQNQKLEKTPKTNNKIAYFKHKSYKM